jgi:hypothetical protein
LICGLIYRSVLANREEDQIFLDASADQMASEQRAIVTQIEQLGRPILVLWVLSGGLLAVIAGMWLYQGFRSF